MKRILFLLSCLFISDFAFSQSPASCLNAGSFPRGNVESYGSPEAYCQAASPLNPYMSFIRYSTNYVFCGDIRGCSCETGEVSQNENGVVCSPTSSSSSSPGSCPAGSTLIEGMCAENASNEDQCPFGYDFFENICVNDNAECSGGQRGLSVVVNISTGETQCSPYTSSAPASSSPNNSSSAASQQSSQPQNSSSPSSSNNNSSSNNSSSNNGGDGDGDGDGDGGGDNGGGDNGGGNNGGGNNGSSGSAGSASSSGTANNSNCSAEPTCEGDAVQCAFLKQLWFGQCEGSQDQELFDKDQSYSEYENSFDQLVSGEGDSQFSVKEDGTLEFFSPEEIDVSNNSAFDLSLLHSAANTGGGASCPSPRSLDLSLGNFDVSYQPLCDFAEKLSYLVIFIFSFISSRLIFKTIQES